MDAEDKGWKDDVFDRKHYADFLTKILLDENKNFVLNIDSSWGSGKSFFLRHWYEDIKQEHPAIFFDAWKTDYSQNPFISITSSFLDSLIDYLPQKQKQQKRKEIYQKVGNILSHTLPTIAKSVVKRYVGEEGAEALNSINADAEDAMANSAENIAQELLKGHSETKDNIVEFKKIIQSIILEINDDNSSVKKPLFVFIDELDRCRPTYAIELLENLKHLFDIEDIIFILATDTAQLASAIKSVYGESFEAEIYLKRFFNQSYTLPSPSIEQFTNLLVSKLECSKTSPFLVSFRSDQAGTQDELKETIAMVSRGFNLTLRDQEQCFFRLQSLIRTFTDDEKIHILFLYYLIVLHHKYGNNFKNKIDDTSIIAESVSIQIADESISLADLIVLYHKLYIYDSQSIQNSRAIQNGIYTYINHLARIVGDQSASKNGFKNVLQKYPNLVLLAGAIH